MNAKAVTSLTGRTLAAKINRKTSEIPGRKNISRIPPSFFTCGGTVQMIRNNLTPH